MINEVILSISLIIGLDVSEVTDVSCQILGASMSMSERIIVRASSNTSLEQISILMNVESVLLTGSQTSEIAIDLAKSVCASLTEVNNTLCNLIRLGIKDADSFSLYIWLLELRDLGIGHKGTNCS